MATNSIPTTTVPRLDDIDVGNIIHRGLKRTLPCKLTNDELLRIAKQRTSEEALRDQVVADFDRIKSKHKVQLEEFDDKINKARQELHTEEQDRQVVCTSVFYRDGAGQSWVVVYRTDTSALVEQRPASPVEAQRHLPGVDGAAPIGGPILDRLQVVGPAAETDGEDDGVGANPGGEVPAGDSDDVTNIDELAAKAAAGLDEYDWADDDRTPAEKAAAGKAAKQERVAGRRGKGGK